MRRKRRGGAGKSERDVSCITLVGMRRRSASASVSPHVLAITVNSSVNVFYIDANRYDSNPAKRPRFL